MSRLFLIAATLVAVWASFVNSGHASAESCQYEIVESMPDKLNFSTSLNFKPKATHESLIEMIDGAKKTIKLASFYVFLSAEDEFKDNPTAQPGRQIMEALARSNSRGVNLSFVLDSSGRNSMSKEEDIRQLKLIGQVKFVNMTKLLRAGVLHSKFLIVDNETLYVGSSNFDWRSYTQIKEMGISFKQCNVLAGDLDKIFETYMLMADQDHIPDRLPDSLKTSINLDTPLNLAMGSLDAKLFMAGSPPAFNGEHHWTGRTDDIDALLHVVNKAKHRVDISVMNYSPRTEFIWPKRFWPRIDNALRRAASERRVQVRLLFSDWSHAKEEEIMWYRSLNAVQSKTLKGGGIHVRMFKVPAYDDFQRSIPYARVKHDKFMVTDNALYIGTSNWSPDYFINTCGVSVVIEPKDVNNHHLNGTIIANMQDLFERDFTSEHSHEL